MFLIIRKIYLLLYRTHVNYVGNTQLYATIDGNNWKIVNDHTSSSGGVQLRIKTIEITYAE